MPRATAGPFTNPLDESGADALPPCATWDTTPHKKAAWFRWRIENAPKHNADFELFCKAGVMSVKDKVCCYDREHAADYSEGFYEQGTIESPNLRGLDEYIPYAPLLGAPVSTPVKAAVGSSGKKTQPDAAGKGTPQERLVSLGVERDFTTRDEGLNKLDNALMRWFTDSITAVDVSRKYLTLCRSSGRLLIVLLQKEMVEDESLIEDTTCATEADMDRILVLGLSEASSFAWNTVTQQHGDLNATLPDGQLIKDNQLATKYRDMFYRLGTEAENLYRNKQTELRVLDLQKPLARRMTPLDLVHLCARTVLGSIQAREYIKRLASAPRALVGSDAQRSDRRPPVDFSDASQYDEARFGKCKHCGGKHF